MAHPAYMTGNNKAVLNSRTDRRRNCRMDELRTEYTMLFNGITEAIKGLEGMKHRLELLQQAAENSYLERCENQELQEIAEEKNIMVM